MLHKTLMIATCFCFLCAPMAMAAETAPVAVPAGQSAGDAPDRGLCYTGHNGTGEIIGWVRDEMQCRTQSSGQSWADRHGYMNYDKDR